MSFENRLKWFLETPRTGVQILVESKLLVLATSNMAYDDAQDFYFMTHEHSEEFFQTLLSWTLVRDQLNFDNGRKWSLEMHQTALQFLVEITLLVLATSKYGLK